MARRKSAGCRQLQLRELHNAPHKVTSPSTHSSRKDASTYACATLLLVNCLPFDGEPAFYMQYSMFIYKSARTISGIGIGIGRGISSPSGTDHLMQRGRERRPNNSHNGVRTVTASSISLIIYLKCSSCCLGSA